MHFPWSVACLSWSLLYSHLQEPCPAHDRYSIMVWSINKWEYKHIYCKVLCSYLFLRSSFSMHLRSNPYMFQNPLVCSGCYIFVVVCCWFLSLFLSKINKSLPLWLIIICIYLLLLSNNPCFTIAIFSILLSDLRLEYKKMCHMLVKIPSDDLSRFW